ncbi:MAG: creatininase family protein [Planctomycetaceae bacterium]|jgi:creatinine amidohydrolase|nr:creatininase family protein [Planctomycetaceae bacterium]
MSSNQIWNLAKANYAAVKSQKFEIAVLPIGATEPHNLHLPYSTDTLLGIGVGERICESAWNRGAKVMLLPAIPYGTETNQREFPFSMNINPSTMYRLITDLTESLSYQGIQKIVLLNSHGGNDFKGYLREMHGKYQTKLFLCDWFKVFNDVYKEIFEEPDDHAGEMETSIALALFPELVARDADGKLLADSGHKQSTRFEAVNRGWISVTRAWHLLTTNTGAGNPHKATAEKGEKVIAVIVERIAAFLKELSDSPLDERFPF